MAFFYKALRNILATSLATTTAVACSSSDSGVDKSGLSALDCAAFEPLEGVTSSVPADYVEILSLEFGALTRRSRGSLCANARDRAKCEADYAKVTLDETGNHLFGPTIQLMLREAVVVTDVDGVRVLRTKDDVKSWIAPIDSPADALAVVSLAEYDLRCADVERGAVGRNGDGYRVLATRLTAICDPIETTQYLLAVDTSGEVRELESDVIESESGSCIGRRPQGLVAFRSDAPDEFARWLADVAHLEAASVASFERLASELEAFGAPAVLIDRARRAGTDEVRHAARMGELAERHGATLALPVVAPFAERSLEAFALENAVEGCVLESFGALVGLAQAERATDRDVRRAMCEIALDEVRHGQLAWEVDAWLATVLDDDARERVRAARVAAGRSLVDAPQSLSVALAERLGIPTGERRRRLAMQFVEQLEAFEAEAQRLTA